MRWKRLRVYEDLGGLMTFLAVVFAWEVSCFAVLGSLALLLYGLPIFLYAAGVVFMVRPSFTREVSS
jgi:hypothetical protein